MRRLIKKMFSYVLVISMCIGTLSITNVTNADETITDSTTTNIAVDINGSENRANLKSPVFEDWTLTGKASPSNYTSQGVNFTLKSSKSSTFDKAENKTLITGDNTPYLTTDGAFVNSKGHLYSWKYQVFLQEHIL